MRLAWFSPMPPVRSGIARCSADLIHTLQQEHAFDVYVDEPVSRLPPAPGLPPPRSAHDFVWRHRQEPYDLAVYQLGNSSHHDYMWPYLFRYPGLAVLHDAHLHHARAALLLRERRPEDYRAEFRANEPDANPDAAELAVAGFDSALLYCWPLTRLPITASRMTVVHSRQTYEQLRAAHPRAALSRVRLGHGTPVARADVARRRARARAQLRIPGDAIVFGVFGGLTPDKRIPQILDAFAALLRFAPSCWLLLAGSSPDHYDVAADIARRNIRNRITLTGYVPSDEELTDCIAAADVTLNLRWPTAREVSGPWLRCLAAGKPSILVDLAHLSDVPTLDPRTWTANGARGARPVAVAIDILDEDHSLRLALRRLATDRALRDTLGEAAREYWRREHSQDAMLEDYRRILPLAAAASPVGTALPAHARDDESALLTSILDQFGVPLPWSNIENPSQRG